ncbi:hypothetical protein [Psychrobacillus sp. FSL H8-0487]|uniref:hypothetical protein n=1 Tax=Psychrobacillus sp. FSL H8-0487 TaxID=2921391 RepID=UPI0030F6AA52
MDIFIDFTNGLILAIADALGWLIDLLPDSPTSTWSNVAPENIVLGHITWFIPFPTMLLHFGILLTCIALYYGYRVVARWLKLVRS